MTVCFKSSEAVGNFDHLIRIIPQESCVVKSLYTYVTGKSYLENAILLDLWGSHIFCLGFMLSGDMRIRHGITRLSIFILYYMKCTCILKYDVLCNM